MNINILYSEQYLEPLIQEIFHASGLLLSIPGKVNIMILKAKHKVQDMSQGDLQYQAGG